MPNNNETYITGLRVVKGRKKSQCLNLSNARIKSYAEIEEMTEDELQGVIICPDYPLEDGHLVPASAIGYEEGTVEDALDDLYEAGNVRYNSETDRFEVKVNGTWVQSIKAFVQSIPVWVDSIFGITMANGVYQVHGTAPAAAFNINGNSIEKNKPTSPNTCTLVNEDAIDFTNYTQAKITVNGVAKTVNLSNISGLAYMAINYDFNGAFSVFINTQKANFAVDALDSVTLIPSTSSVSITEITIE